MKYAMLICIIFTLLSGRRSAYGTHIRIQADNFTFADLVAILHPRYADGTPKVWDDIAAVLPAAKRMVDANIPGAQLKHLYFGRPTVNAPGWLAPAKNWQAGASGDANLSFYINGVSFDNITEAGELIDRKFGHGNSIFERVFNDFDETDVINIINTTRIQALLKQASNQIAAAGSKSIVWEISSDLGRDGIGKLFKGEFPDEIYDTFDKTIFKNILVR